MEANNRHGVGGKGSSRRPRLDDVWQTAEGRLVDVVQTSPSLCLEELGVDLGLRNAMHCDFSTSRLLYRGGDFVGADVNLKEPPGTTLPKLPVKPTPPRRPRVMLVGARRFCRPDQRPYAFEWTWSAMTRVGSLDPVQTPTAHGRLKAIGLDWDYAVDLLPPGDAWTKDDEKRAAVNAAYLRGVAAALNVDVVVCLGGKVCKAFHAADLRVGDFEVGVMQHGYLPVPGPHSRESDFWDSDADVEWLAGCVRDALGVEVAR